jgi:hypothetical protein
MYFSYLFDQSCSCVRLLDWCCLLALHECLFQSMLCQLVCCAWSTIGLSYIYTHVGLRTPVTMMLVANFWILEFFLHFQSLKSPSLLDLRSLWPRLYYHSRSWWACEGCSPDTRCATTKFSSLVRVAPMCSNRHSLVLQRTLLQACLILMHRPCLNTISLWLFHSPTVQ